MKIALFETLPGFGGGNVYQKNIVRALETIHQVEVFPVPGISWLGVRMGKVVQAMEVLKQHPEIDIWIGTYLPTISRYFIQPRGKFISLFYHHDDRFYPNSVVNKLLSELYFRAARKCDGVVTIAEYWSDYLREKNVLVTGLIYWGFDPCNFQFSQEEKNNFRDSHGLCGKPLIYLGNCQELKGVVDAYQQLKHLDAHLVTSGVQRVELPVPNLELNYRDYRLLLASCDVVLTLSRFKEGWNGTAHEAMLAGTPVIGSGLGGMGELLQDGGQIICKDINNLEKDVSNALEHAVELGQLGREFASKFTRERFETSWQNLVARMG